MNSRTKGNEVESLACKQLERDGWTCWRPSSPRRYKPYSSADVFGVFDIIATSQSGTRWIQVKSERYRRKKVAEAIRQVPVLGVKEYWLYYDGKFHEEIVT